MSAWGECLYDTQAGFLAAVTTCARRGYRIVAQADTSEGVRVLMRRFRHNEKEDVIGEVTLMWVRAGTTPRM